MKPPGADGSGAGPADGSPPPSPDGHRGRLRRAAPWVAALAATAVVVAVIASVRLFVVPWTSTPLPADAILVTAGHGDRVATGLELAAEGLAPVIVFSDPGQDVLRAPPIPWCGRRGAEVPAEVICFDPHPATTRGEVRAFAELIAEHGWRRVLLVATDDHVVRARMLLHRCSDVAVQVVAAPSGANPLRRIAYEWGAMAKALVWQRGC